MRSEFRNIISRQQSESRSLSAGAKSANEAGGERLERGYLKPINHLRLKLLLCGWALMAATWITNAAPIFGTFIFTNSAMLNANYQFYRSVMLQ